MQQVPQVMPQMTMPQAIPQMQAPQPIIINNNNNNNNNSSDETVVCCICNGTRKAKKLWFVRTVVYIDGKKTRDHVKNPFKTLGR
jgi:hypothetical protein